MPKLYYVHDPMCSWCWAFSPVLHQVLNQLSEEIEVQYVVGGLAPDSQEPMDEATQMMIQHHWQTIIQRVPGTQFNFDFWSLNTPKRSTYPACRAVLAAKAQNPEKEDTMILAIQQAYYLHAQNPSNDDTLILCAESIGLNTQQFKRDLGAQDTHERLLREIAQARSMPIRGFPSLVLEQNGSLIPVSIDYRSAEPILNYIATVT